MKNLLFTLFIAISPFLFLTKNSFATDKLPEPFQIIPQPKKVELVKGDGLSFGKLTTLKRTGEFDRPVMGSILNLLTESNESGGGNLTLKIDSSGIAPYSREGYVLSILNGDVEIVSGGEAGLFYGCQTLEQLLEDARDFNKLIPACKITDSPALSYRAVHFDVKHHLDHMNYYYESIDRLARFKINAVIFEFEDKLRYRRQPLVGAPQAISIDEMAALSKYAQKRHIEITPLVQGLGHASFILKHEHYAHLRELPDNRWVFCPLDEGTYDVLFDMYLDAIEATPGSRYLHIGGDEIGNIGLCPRCKPTADKEGLIGLNLYWLNRVSEFAKEHGRIPIFWDDMPLKEAGVYKSTWNSKVDAKQAAIDWEVGKPKLEKLIDKFPKECIYMRWNYWNARQPGNIMALDWYHDHGLNVMISTRAGHSKDFIELAAEKGISGVLCTAWDDRSPHMETFWRGLIASAEYSWTPHGRTLEEYDFAYLQREYGTTMTDFASVRAMLKETEVFWKKAFNKKGSRMDMGNALLVLPGIHHNITEKNRNINKEEVNFTDLLIEMPDLKEPGTWSKKYEQRLNEATIQIDTYQRTSKILDSVYHKSKRNRYNWKVFMALNDFQISAPRLLLALKQCDSKKKEIRSNGTENVRHAIKEFDIAWTNLEAVYSKTRFISYPNDYVPDRYFHFASQREDLTWMIQVEELLHPMVNEWLENNQPE